MISLLFISTSIRLQAKAVNYSECRSIQDAIARETLEIASVDQDNYQELAELYVSRGESYLLDAQHEKAIEDFQKATSYLEHTSDPDTAIFTIFRAVFGQVICYDNLTLNEQVQENLQKLQEISSRIGCTNYIENPIKKTPIERVDFHNKNRRTTGSKGFHRGNLSRVQENQDSYDDVLGPNKAPSLGWCEEVIVGVGRAMDAIACLAPNYAVKIALIGIIEALMTRGVKCCQSGTFWKACVAPITRKWKEWKDNKEKKVLPTTQNLPRYTN
jgi:tetratricopeptide (TPR) repeat protein